MFPRSKNLTRGDTQDWIRCWQFKGKGPPKLEWERQRTLKELYAVWAAFLADGERFASYEFRVAKPEWKHQVAVRSAADGSYLQKTVAGPAECFAASIGGEWIVTRYGAELTVWNGADLAAPPKVIREDRDPGWYSTRFAGISLAFHPSERFLAVTGNDTTVKFYDTATWTVAKTFTWKIGRLRSVAFSPDGLLAAAGSDTGKIVVWDVDV